MELEDMFEHHHTDFLPNGRLSDNGKVQFWKEFDYKMKKFDRCQINLKPDVNVQKLCRVDKTTQRIAVCSENQNYMPQGLQTNAQKTR